MLKILKKKSVYSKRRLGDYKRGKMALNFFKKNAGEAPPDVGREEEYEAEKVKKKGKKEEEAPEEKEKFVEKTPSAKPKFASEEKSLEFEKISARLDAIEALMKGYSERFSHVSEQIGEVRTMALTNEKSISKSTAEALKAVDIVREVKPDRLRLDYQRLDTKIATLSEKLEANRQFGETIMNEIKDLRKKAGIFIGTDALLKLNEEVKKDIIELQKLSSGVRLHADKSEQIFIELKRGFAESQKVNEIISNLDVSYSGLKEGIEKLKLDYSEVINRKDFEDFKKTFNNKFSAVESSIVEMDQIKERNSRLGQLNETILSIVRKNKEDIADIAVTIGDDHIKRVSDYEDQLDSILRIIDTLAGQISEIKRKVGMETKKVKISVESEKKRLIGKEKLKMRHVEVHPEVSKPLVQKKAEVPETIKKVRKTELPKIETFKLLEKTAEVPEKAEKSSFMKLAGNLLEKMKKSKEEKKREKQERREEGGRKKEEQKKLSEQRRAEEEERVGGRGGGRVKRRIEKWGRKEKGEKMKREKKKKIKESKKKQEGR